MPRKVGRGRQRVGEESLKQNEISRIVLHVELLIAHRACNRATSSTSLFTSGGVL